MRLRAFEKLRLRMQVLPIRHYRDIEGWLTQAEAVALYRLARRLPSRARVVEIGCWKGKSTYCLARGLKSGTVIAIDPFDGAGEAGHRYDEMKGDMPLVEQFRQNLAHHELLHKVRVEVGRSSQFAGRVGDIDFLFIDGDHSIEGCRYDFETFAPRVKEGGFVAFHDYNPRRPELGPTWVVENLVGPSSLWKLVERRDSLIVFRNSRA